MAFKEPTVQEWQEQIQLAIDYQKAGNRLQGWKQAQNYYMNKYPEDVVSVNLVFAIGRALVPQLYFKTPTVLVQPNNRGAVEMSPVVEAIDKQLVVKMGMKQQIKLGLLDAFTTNMAVFKFGYHSVASELPNKEGGEENGSLVSEFLTSLSDDGEEKADTDDEMESYSYHDFVKKDTPWMLRINPADLLVPYGTLDIHSAPWCAFRIVRLLEDVKNDPNYTNTENLKANTTLIPDVDSSVDGAKSPNTFKRPNVGKGEIQNALEFYEIWDKRSGKIIVIHLDEDSALRNEKHGMPFQGLPIELIQFNPVGWDFWGPSDVDQITQQQIEYNETRTLELMHKRMSIAKFLFEEGSITDTELSKFVKGEISAVKVTGDPQRVVRELNPSMSRDLYNISDVIRTDISEILGFSRNQAGEFDVSRRTATEAGIVQRALEIRSDERRDQVADFIANAFQRKINPLIFQQWNTKRSVQVSGKQGWVDYTGNEIKNDYQVSVIADSVVPLTQAQKQQAASFALDRFEGNPRVDQNRLYQWVFSQFESMGVPQDLLLSEEEADAQTQKLLLEQIAKQGGKENGDSQSPVSQVLQR